MRNECRRFAAMVYLLVAVGTAIAGAQKAPAQKVVFIGDWTTRNWGQPANSSLFQGNPKWINKGATGPETSDTTLARFQSDVVSQRPAIVHILIGAGDIARADDANRGILIENFQANLMAMVAEAGHANIKVILATIPPQLVSNSTSPPVMYEVFEPTLIQSMNAWIETYGAQNHIPVINYHDMLCACVGSSNPSPTGEYPLMASNGATPSPSGFAVMSPIAQFAVDTFNLTMTSGFVQALHKQPSILEGNTLAFTAYGVFSDGIPRALLNTDFGGLIGTWQSSDPTILYVGFNGVGAGLARGEVTVGFTAPNGIVFTPAAVTVNPAGPAP
jgi:hypothetical protein